MIATPIVLAAEGAVGRAAGLAITVLAIVGLFGVGIAINVMNEAVGRLYVRLWHTRRPVVIGWALGSTGALVLGFIFWSLPVGVVGIAGWAIQGLAWNSANTTTAWEDYRASNIGPSGSSGPYQSQYGSTYPPPAWNDPYRTGPGSAYPPAWQDPNDRRSGRA